MTEQIKPTIIDHLKHIYSQVLEARKEKKILNAFFNRQKWPNINSFSKKDSTILIYSMIDWHLAIQYELVLGFLAEYGGSRVLLAGTSLAQKYWKHFGFQEDRFIPWNAFENRNAEETEAIVEDFLSSNPSPNDWNHFSVNGIKLGNHIVSAAGRTVFNADVNQDDPKFFAARIKYLRITILKHLITKQLLEQYNFDQIILNEPNYDNAGISKTMTVNGRSYVQYCQPYEEGALILKRYFADNDAVNPISLSKVTWESLKKITVSRDIEAKIVQIMEEKYSGRNELSKRIGIDSPKINEDKLKSQIGLDQSKKNAVIFSHVLWDANMFWGKDLFSGGAAEWLVETVRFALENPNMNWLVKVHPANVWKMKAAGVDIVYNDIEEIKEKIGILPDNFHIILPEDNINPASLFRITDVGFTIRGTVGMELPLYGIPVITAGTGRYSHHGFTIDPESIDEYRNLILKVHLLERLEKKIIDKAKRFFFGIFSGRSWKSNLFYCNYSSNNIREHNLKLNSWKYLSNADTEAIKFLTNTSDEDFFFNRLSAE